MPEKNGREKRVQKKAQNNKKGHDKQSQDHERSQITASENEHKKRDCDECLKDFDVYRRKDLQ